MGQAGIRIDTAGATVHLRFVGPPANRHLGEEALLALVAAVDSAISDANIYSVCICGDSDVFLAGADAAFFERSLSQGDVEPVLEFTRGAGRLLRTIEQSPKPIVAQVEGLAYGGGLELALACQRIIAGPSVKFALPETGLGIYPGMGGTQRLPRRIGAGLAKWMIYTGAVVGAEQALEIGLIDELCNAANGDELFRSASPRPTTKRGTKLTVLEEFFNQHDVETLCDPAWPLPQSIECARAVAQMRTKAPLALRLAERMIDGGLKLSLEAGIELEFSHLGEVLASEDARTGLAALSSGKRPQFVGR